MTSVLDHLTARSAQATTARKAQDRTGLPIDRIVRVSRKGERVVSSEKFQTERQQLQTIEYTLKAKGLPEGELFTSIDESGHAWEDQRANLAEAMRRIRDGESGGIAVAYFSRFARTAPEAIAAIRELNERGAVFISAQEGLDSTTEMGRFSLGLMALLAEMEWTRLAAGWRTTVDNVIGDGRYVSGAPPVGYCMGSDGRLTPDTRVVGPDGATMAELVAELFRKQVEEKMPWTKLADWFTEVGARPPVADMTERKVADRPARAERYGPDGWQRWSSSSVQAVIKNPAYLGWARQIRKDGEHAINERAHEPLVDEDTWLAAQQTKTNGGRTGEMSNRCLLKSKAVCETCGHTLLITGRFDNRRGERLPLYYCRGRYSDGLCESRGNIDAAKLDTYVEGLFLDHVAAIAKGARRASKTDRKKVGTAERKLDQAETALTYWINDAGDLIQTIGPERYKTELANKQAGVDKAKAELDALRLTDHVADGINTGNMRKTWPALHPLERREILSEVIDKVIVKPAHGKKGRSAPPASERAIVVWKQAFS